MLGLHFNAAFISLYNGSYKSEVLYYMSVFMTLLLPGLSFFILTTVMIQRNINSHFHKPFYRPVKTKEKTLNNNHRVLFKNIKTFLFVKHFLHSVKKKLIPQMTTLSYSTAGFNARSEQLMNIIQSIKTGWPSCFKHLAETIN